MFALIPNVFLKMLVVILGALVVLPANIICAKLGSGCFSVFGFTGPAWILVTAIVAISYLYGLILVFVVRTFISMWQPDTGPD